jgi:hypothetical protein
MTERPELMPIASAVATASQGIKARVEWACEGAIPAEEHSSLASLIDELDEWLLIWKPKLTGETEQPPEAKPE